MLVDLTCCRDAAFSCNVLYILGYTGPSFVLPTCAAETTVTLIPVLPMCSKKHAPCPAASTHKDLLVAASSSKGQEESFSSVKKNPQMFHSFHQEKISDQKETF